MLDGIEHRGLARTGDTLDALYLIAGRKNLFDRFPLCIVQFWLRIRELHRFLDRHNLWAHALPGDHVVDHSFLGRYCLARRELPSCGMLIVRNNLELPLINAVFENRSYFGICHNSHATSERIAK